MEEPHLEPCPFCGGDNLLLQVQENGCIIKGSMGKGKVICGTCGAHGPEVPWMKPMLYPNFRQLVAKKWNTHESS